MKSIIGLFALLLVNISVFGTNLSVDPNLNVMAKSGLKLRLSPNMDAPVLDVIQYGEQVTINQDFVPIKNTFRINWVEGKWLKVNYKNQVGFVFDGFLSSLMVPQEDSEFSANINDLGLALYNWAFLNYDAIRVDTLSKEEYSTTTLTNLSGNELFVHENLGNLKVEFTISDIRIMDAYHLLESMMDTRSARSIFKSNTMFFEDAGANVNKIKIDGGMVTILRTETGKIKISCNTIFEGC